MRTMVLDDRLMWLSGLKTRKARSKGLKLLIQLHRQRQIKDYRGKLSWKPG